MKTLITAAVIEAKAKEGLSSVVYDRMNFIVTPEARDIAKVLAIELQEREAVEPERIQRKFCGVRPTFTASEHELLIHAIKHKVQAQLNHQMIADDKLTRIIEKVLSETQ